MITVPPPNESEQVKCISNRHELERRDAWIVSRESFGQFAPLAIKPVSLGEASLFFNL